MRNYRYTYLMDYVPVRFNATSEQAANRQEVYNFKNGYCTLKVKERLVKTINDIKNDVFDGKTRVCFIPASSHYKTIQRYRNLSSYIEDMTGCPCSISTITKERDEEAGHISGKKLNPAMDYKVNRNDIYGENVILIDDVITRGRTFSSTADKLYDNGAKEVIGLFLAKTIHPN